MHSSHFIKSLVTLLPLAHSAAIRSEISRRDEVPNDVIRFQKCGNLFKVVPDVGGWEQGQMAYWADAAATGAPDDRTVFDMYTRMEDYFYNGKAAGNGNKYGGNSATGSKIWGEIPSVPDINPTNGMYLGWATREVPNGATFAKRRYNCFAKDDWEYTDPEYKDCHTYIECLQKDALQVKILASDEVVREWELAPAQDVYGKFSEAFDEEQGMCKDESFPVHAREISCKVTFECRSHGNKAVMSLLRDQLLTITANELSKSEITTNQPSPQCMGRGIGCPHPIRGTFTSMPKIINLEANSLPQNPDAEYNTEVAYIKATVECEKPDSIFDKICEGLEAAFSATEMINKFSKPAEIAGIATEVGCAAIGAIGG